MSLNIGNILPSNLLELATVESKRSLHGHDCGTMVEAAVHAIMICMIFLRWRLRGTTKPNPNQSPVRIVMRPGKTENDLPGFMVGSIAGYQSPLLCPRTSFHAHI